MKRKIMLSALVVMTAGSVFFSAKPAKAIGVVLDFDELTIIYRDRYDRPAPPPPPPPPPHRRPRGHEIRYFGPPPQRNPGGPRGRERMPQRMGPGGLGRAGGLGRMPRGGPRPPR